MPRSKSEADSVSSSRRRSSLKATATVAADSLEPGFRKIDREELGEEKFMKSTTMCFRAERLCNNLDSELKSDAPAGPIVPIAEGFIGTKDGSMLRLSASYGIESVHANVSWEPLSGCYSISDRSQRINGTAIMLSVARQARSLMRLEIGDEIDVGEFIQDAKEAGSRRKTRFNLSSSKMGSGAAKVPNTFIRFRVEHIEDRAMVRTKTYSSGTKQSDSKRNSSGRSRSRSSDAVSDGIKRSGSHASSESGEPSDARVSFGMVYCDDGCIEDMHLNPVNDGVVIPETVHSVQTLRLKITRGPKQLIGKYFDIAEDEVTIGTSLSNTICIPKTCGIKGVSSIHAKIDRRGEHFWIQDLSIGNPNGTRIVIANTISGENSIKLRKRRLGVDIQEGDIFVLGRKLLLRCSYTSFEPGFMETWEHVALQITRLRTSRRSRRYPTQKSQFKTSYCLLSGEEDTYIGRNIAHCDVSVKDYDLNGITACITQPQDEDSGSCYLENMTNSKRKGVFLLLGRNPAKFDTKHGDDGQFARDDRVIAYDIRRHSAKRISVGGLYFDESVGDNIYQEQRESELVEGDVIMIGRTQLQVADIKVEGDTDISLKLEEHIENLARVDIFENLSADSRREIAMNCIELSVEPGQCLIRQGDTDVDLYIIISGHVEVYKEYDADFVLAELGTGSYFGEIGIVSSYPANASVRTKAGTTPTKFLVLDHFRAKSLLGVEAQNLINILVRKRIIGGVVRELERIPFIKERKLPGPTLEALAYQVRHLSFQSRDDIPLRLIQNSIIMVTQGALTVLEAGKEKNMPRFLFEETTSQGTQIDAGQWIACGPHKGSRIQPESIKTVEADGFTRLLAIKYSVYEKIAAENVEVHIAEMAKRKTREKDARRQTENLSVFSAGGVRRSTALFEDETHSQTRIGSSPKRPARSIHSPTRDSMAFVSSSSSSIRTRASSRFLTVRKSKPMRRRSKVNSLCNIQSADEGEEDIDNSRQASTTSSFRNRAGMKNRPLAIIDTGKSENGNGNVNENRLHVGSDDASDTESEYSSADESEAEDTFPDYSDFLDKRNEKLTKQREKLSKANLAKHRHYILFRAISGPMRKERFLVTAPIAIVGRAGEKKTGVEHSTSRTHQRLELRDRLVSHMNTMIEYKNGVYFVRDMKSRHGTLIKIQEGKKSCTSF